MTLTFTQPLNTTEWRLRRYKLIWKARKTLVAGGLMAALIILLPIEIPLLTDSQLLTWQLMVFGLGGISVWRAGMLKQKARRYMRIYGEIPQLIMLKGLAVGMCVFTVLAAFGISIVRVAPDCGMGFAAIFSGVAALLPLGALYAAYSLATEPTKTGQTS